MEVILLERVNKLGLPGEVVSVKPGYARNFLIPGGKALRATDENKILFEARKKEFEIENKNKLDAAKKLVSAIEGQFVVLIRQAGEDGRLFGSVSSRDIADQLSQDVKSEIKRSYVVLKEAVKYLGIYEIDVFLHAEVFTKIRLNVARSVSEAEEAKKTFLKNSINKKDEGEAIELVSQDTKVSSKKGKKVAEDVENIEDEK